MNQNALLEEIIVRAKFLTVFESSTKINETKNQTAVIEKGTRMSFPMITDAEGHAFQPVFADWAELGKWQSLKKPPQSLVVSFDDLHAMISQQQNIAGIVINPFGESFVMSREWMAALKIRKDVNQTGMAEITVEKPTTVRLGEPNVYPTEMVRAITSHLEKSPAVTRAWLRLMEKDGELSYLLVLDFTGDRRVVFDGIGAAARPYLNGMYLDMVPYNDSLGRQATEGVKAFFGGE
jgi:hypothetical protein